MSKKLKSHKVIVNPIFLEFIPYTLDKFWQDRFTAFAYGKFPKCLEYKSGAIVFKKKGVGLNCDLDEDNIEESYLKLKDFMKTSVKLYSPLDQEIEDEKIMKINSANLLKNKTSWSQIKKARIKQFLIDQFINEKSKQYILTARQIKDLTFQIQLGLLFKIINSKTVKLSEGRIEEIKGLYYDDILEKFELDLGNLDKYINAPKKAKSKRKVVTPWDSYMKSTMNQIEAARKLGKKAG